METPSVQDLTLGEVVSYFVSKHPGARLRAHHLRRLFERRDLPEPRRVRHFRLVSTADLPAYEEVLRKHGYLRAKEG